MDFRKVPHFITAKSREDLQLKMYLTNKASNACFIYRDISFDGKLWTAWYLRELLLTPEEKKAGLK